MSNGRSGRKRELVRKRACSASHDAKDRTRERRGGSGRWVIIKLGEREAFRKTERVEGGGRPCLIIDFKLSALQSKNERVQACAGAGACAGLA